MAKRVFDVTLTLVFAPMAALAAIAMAIVLAVDLRGNPLFVQERIGLNGRPFRMYKLRTMRHAPPGARDCYEIRDWESFVFSPSGEQHPRLTRWGAVARKFSLDELPNLVNVVRGEMSLVGPRPEIPQIVAQYPACYHRRHQVLPGIAGLAQVSGRSDLTYHETLKYDLAYVDGHSLAGDLRILVETVAVVSRGSGAR